MSETSTVTIAIAATPENTRSAPRKRVKAWRILLIISLSTGLFLFALGLLLSLLSMLKVVGVNNVSGTAESVILIVAFVLLFVAAHCLDRIKGIRDEG